MPFLKTDDNYTEDERFEGLSYEARWLHWCALEYCARRVTDGQLSKSRAHRISDVPDAPNACRELVAAGLWRVTLAGYELPDYLAMNRTRQQVERDRAQARRRKEEWLDKNAKQNATKNGVPNGKQNASLPYPSPPEGRGEGAGADSPGGSPHPDKCKHGTPNGNELTSDGVPICLNCERREVSA